MRFAYKQLHSARLPVLVLLGPERVYRLRMVWAYGESEAAQDSEGRRGGLESVERASF